MDEAGTAIGFGDGTQAGDQSFGSVAGGNIYHGADPAALLRVVERAIVDSTAHERAMLVRAIEGVQDQVRDLAQELRAHEREQHDQALADVEDRERRRDALDVRLDRIDRRLGCVAAYLAAATVAGIAVAVVVAALAYDRATAAALARLWIGSALAIAGALWRWPL